MLVFVSLLAVGAGIESMVVRNVRADRVMVTKANRLEAASITGATTVALGQLSGVKRANGAPLVSASLPVVLKARRRGDRIRTDINARGVDGAFLALHQEVELAGGRMFRSGTYELIVGKSARSMYDDIDIGDELLVRGARWKIVGVFSANGGIDETWLLGDLDTFKTAFDQRGPSEVTVILDSPESIGVFRDALEALPGQTLIAATDLQVRQRQTRSLSSWANFVSYFVGAIMGVGALVASSSAIFAIVDHRRRATATLQAIGFHPAAVFFSIVVESFILAIPGIALGVALPWIAINGMHASFVGLDFSLAVTPQLVTTAVGAACAIAFLGGALPALHGMRTSIAQALRA